MAAVSGPRVLQPCGTRAAYQRHVRHGEPACAPCRAAESRGSRQRRAPTLLDPFTEVRAREIRDPVVPYQWRARRYTWAVEVLARAEAAWGRPEDEEAA